MAPARLIAALVVPADLAIGLCACSERPSAAPAQPVQILEEFALTETERGVTQWILRAQQATLHDAGNADLAAPHVEIYEAGKPKTRGESKRGGYDESTRDIHMQDDVLVVTRDEDSGPTTIKTDSLDFVNAKQRFQTDRPVVIEREGSVMHGQGMTASQDLSEIHVWHQESNIQ